MLARIERVLQLRAVVGALQCLTDLCAVSGYRISFGIRAQKNGPAGQFAYRFSAALLFGHPIFDAFVGFAAVHLGFAARPSAF